MRAYPTQAAKDGTMAAGLVAGPLEPAVAILDLGHLRRFTFGSVAFEHEILGLFAAELPKSQAAIAHASTAAQWKMATHTLKGSALGVGAGRLAQAARAAEGINVADAHVRATVIARMDAAIVEVLHEVASLLVPPEPD